MKAVLREKLRALSAHMNKLENSHTRELTSQLKAIEQMEANSPESSRGQKILKLRVEINKVKTKKTIQRINVTELILPEK
ncbi:hypothetical protein ACQP3J_32305, partial [Escherichia coli]